MLHASQGGRVAELDDVHYHDLCFNTMSFLFERTDHRVVAIKTIIRYRTMEMLKWYAHLRSGKLVLRPG